MGFKLRVMLKILFQHVCHVRNVYLCVCVFFVCLCLFFLWTCKERPVNKKIICEHEHGMIWNIVIIPWVISIFFVFQCCVLVVYKVHKCQGNFSWIKSFMPFIHHQSILIHSVPSISSQQSYSFTFVILVLMVII